MSNAGRPKIAENGKLAVISAEDILIVLNDKLRK